MNRIQQSDQDVRAFLLTEAFRFIDRIVVIPGLRRIAMIGSLISSKAEPKDVDILITIDDEANLTALATAAPNKKQGRRYIHRESIGPIYRAYLPLAGLWSRNSCIL